MDTETQDENSRMTLKLIIVVLLIVFIASTPIWLAPFYGDRCPNKIREPCIDGKSRVCDIEELCCKGVNSTDFNIRPGDTLYVNCTFPDNITFELLSSCENGVLTNIDNCTLV